MLYNFIIFIQVRWQASWFWHFNDDIDPQKKMTVTPLLEKKTVVVGGNATLDSLIQGVVRVDGPRITITSGNATEFFEIEDPPIRPGYKHRVRQDIGERTKGLLHQIKPGGGGYNSVTALRRLSNTAELDLAYVDVSAAGFPCY